MQSTELLLQNLHWPVIQAAVSKGLSFALFREPDRPIQLIYGKAIAVATAEDVLRSGEYGFLISPFQADPQCPLVWIPHQESTLSELQIQNSNEEKIYFGLSSKSSGYESNRINYENFVRRSIDFIGSGQAQKIVGSRVISLDREVNQSIYELFLKLCTSYPAAFVSFVSSPLCGTWITASPELLMKQEADGVFETVALAGTQPAVDNLPVGKALWSAKEIEEQALVSRHIINCFKAIRLREFDEDGPHTITAGHLLHLKTTFKVDTIAHNREDLMSVMLPLLHPTSAVCGMPQQTALDFIRKSEGYSRRYYTGYLGALNDEGRSALYVNLRCMQVLENTWELYAGGGITIASELSKEWQETEFKLNTLRSLLF